LAHAFLELAVARGVSESSPVPGFESLPLRHDSERELAPRAERFTVVGYFDIGLGNTNYSTKAAETLAHWGLEVVCVGTCVIQP
jgi:hypothetical protein